MQRAVVTIAIAIAIVAGVLVLHQRGSGSGGQRGTSHLIDIRRAAIGGVRVRTTRAAAERLLGRGRRLSRTLVRSSAESRYRTADGIGVGTSVARLRAEASLQCANDDPLTGAIECERGGYHQPVTAFDAQHGSVVRVAAMAAAD